MSLGTESGGDLDLAAVIHMLQELKKTASPEDLIALHKALLPTKKTDTTSQSPVEAAAPPELARVTTTRRSGLHIPGLATRGGETDVLRKHIPVPGVQHVEQTLTKWGPEMQENAPTVRLYAPDARNARKVSGPRPMTPTDLDYARIGEKLGTLRVMNGAATPERCTTPTREAGGRLPISETHIEDGYYTASEGRVSPEDALHQQSPRKQSSNGPPQKPSLLIAPTPVVDPHSHSQPATAHLDIPPTLQRSRSRSDTDKIYISGPDYVVRDRTPPDMTSSIALDYMAELCSSPYTRPSSPSRNPVPHSMEYVPEIINNGTATAKPLPAEPQPLPALPALPMLTFETSHPHDSSIWLNDKRAEQFTATQITVLTNADILRNTHLLRNAHLRQQSLASSIYVDEGRSCASDIRTSLVQTDSGYNSETSVKASQDGQPQNDELDQASLRVESPTKQNDGHGPQSFPSIEDLTEVRSLYTLEEMLRHAPPTSNSGTVIPLDDVAQPLKKSPSRFQRLRSKSFRKESKKTLPPSPLAESGPPVATTTAAQRNARSDATPGHKKLQKQRPLSQAVLSPAMNAHGSKDTGKALIPGVPEDVAKKFLSRLSLNSSTERLTHSCEAPRPILSQENLQLPAEDDHSTTRPSTPGRPSKPDVGQRSWFPRKISAGKPLVPPTHQANDNKPKADQALPDTEDGISHAEEQLISRVADFGTVAHQLGGSPYDIAMRIARPKSTPVAPHQILHPYQMGAFFPRSKLMMNEETAAEFARRKSHDLQNTRLTRSISRPRSYHDQDLEDRRYAGGMNSRPSSIYMDVPPVPALPTAHAMEKSRSGTPEPRKSHTLTHQGSEESRRPDNASTLVHETRQQGTPPREPVAQRFELDGAPSRAFALYNAEATQQVQQSRFPALNATYRTIESGPHTDRRDFALTANNPPPPPPKTEVQGKPALYKSFQRRSFVGEIPQYNPMKRWSLEQSQHKPLPPVKSLPAPPSTIVTQGPAFQSHEEPKKAENQNPLEAGHQRIDWEAEALLWRKRRQSVGEGLLKSSAAQEAESSNNSSTKTLPIPSPTPSITASQRRGNQGSLDITRRPELSRSKSSGEAIFDRYSGGFDYDYEHGFGFGGSAGTRSVWSEASRKSQQYSVQHGLDLSDVPVFLHKV